MKVGPNWGYALRVLRAMRGETQHELAASAKVAHSYVSAIENGDRSNISIDVLHRLSEHYGCSLSELVRVAEEDHSVLESVAKAATSRKRRANSKV